MVHPAFVYLPGERLTLAELGAARLDGHVVDLGEAYIPADLVETAAIRAATLAALIPARTAASGPTAAWIHGAGDQPPNRHHVRRAVPHRIRPTLPPRVVLHDTPVEQEHLVRVGGVLVMSAARTMVDLALGLHRDPTLREWMVLLAAADAGLAGAGIALISAMSRVPGSRSGRAVLERLSRRRQEEVTR